jgi:hypothetical protein
MVSKVVKSVKGSEPAKSIASPAPDKNALQVEVKKGESADLTVAKKLTNPQVTAVLTMREFQPLLKQHDVNEMVTAINDEARQVLKGEMTRAEEMLISQAHTLDAIFNTLAQRAAANMGTGHLQATDTYMRMALKAQSQCRTTLEALSEIKNPRTATFIKQQNVAGQQQVNNGKAASPRLEKDVTPTNELLAEPVHAAMDTGTAGAAGRVNQKVVAMAEVHRSKE